MNFIKYLAASVKMYFLIRKLGKQMKTAEAKKANAFYDLIIDNDEIMFAVKKGTVISLGRRCYE